MEMGRPAKTLTLGTLSWCVATPLVWINNNATSVNIPVREVVAGAIPDITLAILCLGGIIAFFLARRWLPHYLFASCAMTGGVLFAFGSISAHGVMLDVALVIVVATSLLLRRRPGAASRSASGTRK